MRAATMAAVEALVPDDIGDPFFSLHGDSVTHDDSGGNHWTLTLVADGRAVLSGCDHEASTTRDREPPLDLLADAPPWLPLSRLSVVQQARELGFVYWYDTAWHRIPYAADVRDDGLASTVGRTVDMRKLVGGVSDVVLGYKLGECIDDDDEHAESALDEAVRRAQDGALEKMVRQARERALAPLSFAWLSGPWDLDTTAALDIARRAGLTHDSTGAPRVPTG